MLTQCSQESFAFAGVEGRRVEAAFDGGAVTSDAGALLLGATDRAIGLVARFAACFRDARSQPLVEHAVATLERIVGQIRQHWPRVKIVLRADSGFAREGLMGWCEANRVD